MAKLALKTTQILHKNKACTAVLNKMSVTHSTSVFVMSAWGQVENGQVPLSRVVGLPVPETLPGEVGVFVRRAGAKVEVHHGGSCGWNGHFVAANAT